MTSTGIIRRIDDLGRVVIPREIRRRLHIVEGDPLEISVDGDTVSFRKYRTGDSFGAILVDLRDAVADEPNLAHKAEIIDRIKGLAALMVDKDDQQ